MEDGGEEEGEPFGGITVLPSSSGVFGEGRVDQVFLQYIQRSGERYEFSLIQLHVTLECDLGSRTPEWSVSQTGETPDLEKSTRYSQSCNYSPTPSPL